MNITTRPKRLTPVWCLLLLATAILSLSARADTFGSGSNTFSIRFQLVGNAGNAADTTGYGAVPYTFNMGTYAISQADIDAATALGATNLGGGAWTGSQPAANLSWYEAAAFVNWLNTSQGYTPAYNLTYNGSWSMSLWSPAQAWQLGGQDLYRNAGAHYFLPNENEYYKAAYYDPNANAGAGGYWLYPTGSNTAPTPVASGTAAGTAVYSGGGATQPAAMNSAGGPSPYGTMGQSGNVYEWMESSYTGDYSSSTENRAYRGGSWLTSSDVLQATFRSSLGPSFSSANIGFRVASIPEPSSTLLMIGSGWMFLARRRRARSL